MLSVYWLSMGLTLFSGCSLPLKTVIAICVGACISVLHCLAKATPNCAPSSWLFSFKTFVLELDYKADLLGSPSSRSFPSLPFFLGGVGGWRYTPDVRPEGPAPAQFLAEGRRWWHRHQRAQRGRVSPRKWPHVLQSKPEWRRSASGA